MTPDGPAMFDPNTYRKVTLPPLQAETLPAWCYADPAFHRREAEQIFLRSWLCVGREELLPNPGDYRAIEICGAQVILLRDKAGEIRVLDNVCRHRGMLLVEGTGNAPAIRCPYHNWAYGLDGSLRAAAGMEQTGGFDKKQYGLGSHEVRLWKGFIFTRLQPGGPDFESCLGEIDRFVEPYRLEEMRCAGTSDFRVECNWKLFLEVFMEDYHVKPVHKNSIADIYVLSEIPEGLNGDFAYINNPHGPGTSALMGSEQHLRLPQISETMPNGTRYFLVYPAFAFACTVDCMWFFEIYPEGPSRTRVLTRMCFPESTVARSDFAEKFAGYKNRWTTSMAEDIEVLERQQRGLASGQFRPGRFSHLEPVVSMFSSWVARHAVDQGVPA